MTAIARMALTCALGVAACGTAGAALAQSVEERFTLERTEDGYVRMDTRTGAMALCRENGSRLECRPAMDAPDQAPDGAGATIAELRAHVARLESRIAALETQARVRQGLPDEAEFERGLGYMERFFRRFLGVVEEFEGDRQPSATGEGPR